MGVSNQLVESTIEVECVFKHVRANQEVPTSDTAWTDVERTRRGHSHTENNMIASYLATKEERECYERECWVNKRPPSNSRR